MSTEALHGLLEYLQEALSLENRKWLAEHLIDPSEEAFPQLTIEEINERIRQSEQDYKEGRVHTNEEMIAFMNDYLQALNKPRVSRDRGQQGQVP